MERESRAKINIKDIRDLRIKIQVNDTIIIHIKTDSFGEKLLIPIRIERRVAAKYPHLIELDRRGTQIETLTYADLLIGQGGKLDV